MIGNDDHQPEKTAPAPPPADAHHDRNDAAREAMREYLRGKPATGQDNPPDIDAPTTLQGLATRVRRLELRVEHLQARAYGIVRGPAGVPSVGIDPPAGEARP